MEIDSWDPSYPNNDFEPFVKSVLRAVSAGMGVSYHGLTNDLTDVNYSSIRQGELDIRGNWRVMQKWFIRKFMSKIYRVWLPMQLRHGTIKVRRRVLTLNDLQRCLQVTWTGRRWEWIDPKSEAIANVEQIRHFLISPSQVIRDLGRDPQEVWRQIAEDIKSMKDADIPEKLIWDILSSKIQQFEVADGETEPTNDNSSAAKQRKQGS